jgi:DNA-binding transcriptional MerR regulator
VRKKLIEARIELTHRNYNEHTALKKKVRALREKGLNYQAIADIFNLWKIATRTGDGKWHAKTIRELIH